MNPTEEANTNCLSGMRCPECGSLGDFRISVVTMAVVSDDGVLETNDHEWDNNSYCECCECSHSGTVGTFTEETPDEDNQQ